MSSPKEEPLESMPAHTTFHSLSAWDSRLQHLLLKSSLQCDLEAGPLGGNWITGVESMGELNILRKRPKS